MKSNEYHVHVNCYRISEKTITKLEALGLNNDPFTENDQHEFSPKEHYSFYECISRIQQDSLYKDVLQVLEEDQSFMGYVETETCPLKLKHWFCYKPFLSEKIEFPIARTILQEVPLSSHKACDIHIDRPWECPRDELDIQLQRIGFFEVHTLEPVRKKPLERIYTIQTQNIKNAKLIYKQLFRYLQKVGGALKIELEYTHNFSRFPRNFRVAPYITKVDLN